MKFNELSNVIQVYIVTNFNSQIAAFVRRLFSKTNSALWVSSLLNLLVISMTKQGVRKLRYILTVKTRYEQI